MRTASNRIRVAFALVFAIGMPPAARAQTAEAETLFREGMRLMKQERFAEACEKFESSERIEPAFGTEYNLANCREKNGQTASAWAMFLKAAATAKRMKDDRADGARERADLLADQLVYLTIRVPSEVEIDGLMIERDDAAIDRGLWDQQVPVDPGTYTISAEAPGHEAWSKTVTVKTKNRVIEIPPLERRPTKERGARARDKDDPAVEQRKYGAATITLAVVGGSALVIGTGFGVYSQHLETRSDVLCPTLQCADADGVELNRRARRDALIANISWGIGGAALVGALALWWMGGPTANTTVAITPVVHGGQTGLAVGGRF